MLNLLIYSNFDFNARSSSSRRINRVRNSIIKSYFLSSTFPKSIHHIFLLPIRPILPHSPPPARSLLGHEVQQRVFREQRVEETRLPGTTAMPVTNLGRLAIVMFNQTCNYVYYGSRLAGAARRPETNEISPLRQSKSNIREDVDYAI